MATEQNINPGHRYLIQLSVKQDHFLYNTWDYVESIKSFNEAESLCESLFDDSIHKLQIADLVTNAIVRTWTRNQHSSIKSSNQ